MSATAFILGAPREIELFRIVESGPAANKNEQWGFLADGLLCRIVRVIERPAGDERDCLHVLVQDGRRFVLRHDDEHDRWIAAAFVRPAAR
jgi:hypothetical protein